MKLFEMEGFLRGKCLPGDMKVNETNAEYLVRKFAEADAKCAALASLEAEAVPPAPVSVPVALNRLRSIVADPRALPRRKEWVSGQQYSYVLLESVEAMIDEACRAAMLQSFGNSEQLNSPVIADGWVACSKRMPESMVSVLVTGTWFHHAVSFWDGVSWCDLDFEQPVTHWQPLPAAPQQEVK